MCTYIVRHTALDEHGHTESVWSGHCFDRAQKEFSEECTRISFLVRNQEIPEHSTLVQLCECDGSVVEQITI